MSTLGKIEQGILDDLVARRPDLEICAPSLISLYEALADAYDGDAKLIICGNGGSHADAVHIVGELCKSFERKRPLSSEMANALEGLPWGEELAANLEQALPAIALGLNGSLKTAVENDSPLRDIAFAQETLAMARTGDVFLAISTSGNAANCMMAMSAAKASGCITAALTGPHGGKLAIHADLAIHAPGDSVKTIQEAHITLYHTLCAMIEARYFPEPR